MKYVQIEEPRSDEEQAIYDALEELKRAYQRQAQPFIDRLVAIQSSKPMRGYFIREDGDPVYTPPATESSHEG